MTPPPVLPGLTATMTYRVGGDDTAWALGSGALEVLGTPRLLAWMESATCSALAGQLASGESSVGTRVTLEHLKASSVGEPVTVCATVQHVDGRLVRFEVVATQADGQVMGHAEITRVVVDERRFLARH